jgi:hypothetical protein
MINAVNYMNIVKGEARRISKARGMNEDENDDLVAEGNLILCRCVEGFKPELGIDFSVYLREALDRGLHGYARKQFRRWVNENDFTDETPEPFVLDRSYQAVVLEEALETMSEPARYCVELVLDPPEELLDYRTRDNATGWGRKMTRHTLRKYLRDIGWYGCQITSAFREIQTTLQSVQ